MYSLDFYRQNYPKTLGGLSDVDTVYKIAELSGENPQDLAVHFGMVDPEQGDFMRGGSSGIDSMQAGGYGMVGYAGDVVGADSVRDWGYEGYKENMDMVNLRAKDYDQFENIDSFGEGVDSAQYWLGYSLPQIVEAVFGSKGGAYLGRKGVESRIRKKVVERFGKDKADAIMMSKPVQNAISKGEKLGSYAGIGTQAVGTELGHTYGGAVDEAIHQGGTIEDVDLGDVTLYGGLAGATEFGTDVLTLGLAKFGPAKNLIDKAGKSTSRTVNATTRGLAGGTAEAGTEMVQTGLEEMGAGKSYEEANFSDPTSAWAGFVGGGAMGLGGGLATRPKDKPTNTGSDEELNESAKQADAQAQQQADDALQAQQQAEVQQQQMEAEIDLIKSKRQEHSANFPDEDVWYKLDEADFNMQQRTELANPTSELGQAFSQWQKDNDIYDTNDKVIKQFLNDYNVAPNSEQKKEAYLGALDQFVEYQEDKATRSSSEQVRIGNELESMLDMYNDAVADGDLARINSIEAQASELFHPAEWAEAKRDNAFKAKGAKDATKVAKNKGQKIPNAKTAEPIEAADTNTAPIEVPTEATEEVNPNPWVGTRSKKKAEFWDKAAAALGAEFETNHPDLSAHFGKDVFSTAKATKTLDKIVTELEQQKADELIVDNEKKPAGDLDSTQQDAKAAEDNLSHPKERFVFNFLLDAAEKGELGRYYELKDGKPRWFGTTLADDMFARYGDDKMAEYEFKNNKDSRKRLNEVAKRIAERSKDLSAVRQEQIKKRGNVSTTDNDAKPLATKGQVVDVVNDSDSGININKSADTGAGVGKLDKGTEAWVDKKAEEANQKEKEKVDELVSRKKKLAVSKASEEEVKALNDEVNQYLLDNPGAKTKVASEFDKVEAVEKALDNKNLTKKAAILWNRHRKSQELTYSKVPNEVKYEWVQSVATYIADDNIDALKSDLQAAETMAAEVETKTKEVEDGKTNSKRGAESEKGSDGSSEVAEESPESRSDDDAEGGKVAESVVRKRKSKRKVAPKLDLTEGVSKEEHYKSMTRKDLYDLAKTLGLKVKANFNKSQIIQKLLSKNIDFVKERDLVLHKTKKLNPNWVITEPEIVDAIGADDFALAHKLIDESLSEKAEDRALKHAKRAKKDQLDQGKDELIHDKARLEKAKSKIDMAYALNEFGVELGNSSEESINALMRLTKSDLSAMVEDALGQVKEALKGNTSKTVNVKQSKSEGKIKNPTTKEAIRKEFIDLLGEANYNRFAKHRVHYVNSAKEADKVYERLLMSAIKRLGTGRLSIKKAKELKKYVSALVRSKVTRTSKEVGAFVTPAMGGRPHVVFIVPHIRKGDEKAVFVHEVGAHIGMENVFTPKMYKSVVDQIKRWADAPNDNSQEVRIAKVVKHGVDAAVKRGDIPKEHADNELVAYFLTRAVREGVTPESKNTIGSLLLHFKKVFLKFLGMVRGEKVNMTAKDIVDMAQGAAGIEFSPRFLPRMEGISTMEGVSTFKFSSSKLEPKHVQDIDTKTNKEEIGTTRDWIRDHFGATTTQLWDDSVEVWRSGIGATKFLHQFINEVKERMPSAEKWHNAILTAERTRNEIKQAVEDIAVRAREMADSDLEKANKFIYDSTFYQKWGYNPYDKSNPKYKKVHVDSAMAARFNALNANQQQLIKDIFSHGHTMLERKQEIAKLFGVDKAFFGVSGMDGPYAPLKRFGNYVSEFKSQVLIDAERAFAEKPNNINKKHVDSLKSDANHYVISFHSSMGKAKNFVDRNKYKFASAVASPKTEVLTEGRSPDHKVLAKVLGGLGASGLDKASKEYKAMEQMVKDMYFETLDEDNARRSQAKRMNRAGAEENMVRSFLANATAEANLVASMEHGAEINTALAEASNEKNKDKEHLGRIYNMMVSHYVDHLNNKQTPIQDRLAAMNTVYMLTSSVGYHITNATQPIMVTIPKIAGDFGGYTKVIRKLMKGYRIARSLVSFDFKNLQTGIDIDKAPKKYQALLKDLQLRQLLDVGIEQDLSEFNRTDTGYQLVNKGSEKASNFAHRLYQIARLVEAYNRISSAVAAYDMAEANPSKIAHKNMTSAEYATNIVEDTQGNFSAIDAPLILKKLPKITGQYRKYQIMMAWVYADATKKAFAGTSSAEKEAGRRTMGYALWHASLFSGATGVPLLGWIAPMFLGMGADGDEPQDLERWIRSNVGDEKLADLLTRGLPAMLGLDMSTKLSQQKIFHPLPYTDFAADQNSMKEAVFEAILGPFGTTATNFMRSAEYAKEGNLYRATEYALPKGVRTAMESYRLATEGYSLRNGDVVADPEDFSGLSIVFNTLGVPATEVTKLKWSRGQQYELKDWFEKEQSNIRKQYIKAYKEKDRAGKKEWREKWKELQKAKDRVRPFFHDNRKELKKTPLSSLLKAPQKQQKREKNYRKSLGTD